MIKTLLLSAAAFLAVSAVPAAAAQGGVELGVLDCSISGGTGFIIGSKKDLHCTFNPAGRASRRNYFGAVRKWGIDIGTTDQAVIRWLVLCQAANLRLREHWPANMSAPAPK